MLLYNLYQTLIHILLPYCVYSYTHIACVLFKLGRLLAIQPENLLSITFL
jgi:hypothetical protein